GTDPRMAPGRLCSAAPACAPAAGSARPAPRAHADRRASASVRTARSIRYVLELPRFSSQSQPAVGVLIRPTRPRCRRYPHHLRALPRSAGIASNRTIKPPTTRYTTAAKPQFTAIDVFGLDSAKTVLNGPTSALPASCTSRTIELP